MKIKLTITIEKDEQEISKSFFQEFPDSIEDAKTLLLKTILVPFAKMAKSLLDNIDELIAEAQEKVKKKTKNRNKSKKKKK